MWKMVLLMFLVLSPAWAQSEVELVPLRPDCYLHRSFMQTDDFGRVDCNGLVYVVDGEALVVDMPATDQQSEALLAKIQDDLGGRVIGAVVGHWHADSMGGLSAFLNAGIPTYASRQTQRLARQKGLPVPRAGFDQALDLSVGGRTVRCQYFGPGHTEDIAVTYLVEEKVLFGGCLVKAVGSGRGYLGDADVPHWSDTVRRVREAFPEVELVVPGHGECGDSQLLDYTIELFRSP